MNVGARIRLFRTRKKMSQEELAWMANITPAYLGQIERSKKSPTITILIRIARALGISLSELFSGPVDAGEDRIAAMRQIQYQLRNLSADDLRHISAIIENIIAIKGRRPS